MTSLIKLGVAVDRAALAAGDSCPAVLPEIVPPVARTVE